MLTPDENRDGIVIDDQITRHRLSRMPPPNTINGGDESYIDTQAPADDYEIARAPDYVKGQ